jgi:hypothetical protein
MKATQCSSIVIVALALVAAAVQLPAAVKVDTAEPIETLVAFRVAANKYIGTSPSNSLELAVGKIGSKQRFTIIDLTGGNLQDGDEIRIRYTPHNGKPSYWLENTAGVRRGRDGDVFKLKRVDTKFVLVTPTGKFVAPPVDTHALGVSAKQDGALVMEIIDVSSGTSVVKPPDQPASGSTAPAAPTAPAPTPPSTSENTEAAPPAAAPTPPAVKPATP